MKHTYYFRRQQSIFYAYNDEKDIIQDIFVDASDTIKPQIVEIYCLIKIFNLLKSKKTTFNQ